VKFDISYYQTTRPTLSLSFRNYNTEKHVYSNNCPQRLHFSFKSDGQYGIIINSRCSSALVDRSHFVHLHILGTKYEHATHHKRLIIHQAPWRM